MGKKGEQTKKLFRGRTRSQKSLSPLYQRGRWDDHNFWIFTAQTLYSGILATGSRASRVNRLAAASLKWKVMNTMPGGTVSDDFGFHLDFSPAGGDFHQSIVRPDSQPPRILRVDLHDPFGVDLRESLGLSGDQGVVMVKDPPRG